MKTRKMNTLLRFPIPHAVIVLVALSSGVWIGQLSPEATSRLVSAAALGVGSFWLITAIYMSALSRKPSKPTVVWVFYIVGASMFIIGHQLRTQQTMLLPQMRILLYLSMLYIGVLFASEEIVSGDLPHPKEEAARIFALASHAVMRVRLWSRR